MVDHDCSTFLWFTHKTELRSTFQTNQYPRSLSWSPLSTVAPSFDCSYPDHAEKLLWPPLASQLPTKKPSSWLSFSLWDGYERRETDSMMGGIDGSWSWSVVPQTLELVIGGKGDQRWLCFWREIWSGRFWASSDCRSVVEWWVSGCERGSKCKMFY